MKSLSKLQEYLLDLYNKMFPLLRLVLIVAGISALSIQQVAGFTISDFQCAEQGDFGGTCFYESCAASSNPSSSTSPTPSLSGVSFDAGMSIDDDGSGTTTVGSHQSGTSLDNGGTALNADQINYIALAQGYASSIGLQLGDIAAVSYNGNTAYAVYGDNWQNVNQIHGEGSVHLASTLGILVPPASSSASSGVHYVVFPGTHSQLGTSFDQNKIDQIGAQTSGGSTGGSSSSSSSCCPGSTTGSGSGSTSTSGDIVSTFLQALAFQENGGAVTGGSGTGAKGKYQYMDSTWHASAQSYYPPADKYATANDAPEAVQDAVAYLEYTVKFKQFNGDVFKIAVSHFLPAANSDPTLLDQIPSGNVITPRQYANSIINHIKKGDGKSIAMKYASAPDFAKWLAKAGGPYTGSGSTPATPSGSGGGSCQCNTSAQQTSGGDTIVIDPGHDNFSDPSSRNSLTGLYDMDTSGAPNEMHNAWIAAGKIKSRLESAGYKVVLTKNSETDPISLSERAQRANDTNGALLFTMHADSTARWLAYPDSNSTRTPGTGSRKDGTDGLVHPGIEGPSKQLAEKMAPIIASATHIPSYKALSFNDYYGAGGLTGNGLNKGNTPVQTILSSIPEVYSETDINVLPSDTFADAVTGAIKAAVPLSGSPATPASASATGSASCSGAASGTIQAAIDLAMKYAWPDGRQGTPSIGDATQAYQDAIKKADANGEYHGGCDGIDCGAFITRVMRDSGADPNYNWGPHNPKEGPTSSQQAYLDANTGGSNPKYKKIGAVTSTKDLQPGDIAIVNGGAQHTYMYVGPVSSHPSFLGDAASSSLCGYAPTANTTQFSESGSPFTWYRLIR